MLYSALKLVHLLSIIVWVGGMVFDHFFLRPAVAQWPPPQRLELMHAVLGRFFTAVGVAVLLVLATGTGMVMLAVRDVAGAGGRFAMPLDWNIMATIGLVMVAIFGHIRFALFLRLRRAIASADWPAGGATMQSIRRWVSVNLALGVAIVGITILM